MQQTIDKAPAATDALGVLEVEELSDLHLKAEALRNPYQSKLISLAREYANDLASLTPEGTIIDLGGSLASQTAIRGQNDVDLKILLPEGKDSEEMLRALSEKVAGIIPFNRMMEIGHAEVKKINPKHSLVTDVPGIEGPVKIDVVISSTKGRVGYGYQMNHLPQNLLDEYVLYKAETEPEYKNYKKVKKQFYALTRWLYANGYMSPDFDDYYKAELLDKASAAYWGSSVSEILSRPQPDI